MFTDKFGQIVLNEQDLLNLYYKDPDIKFRKALTESQITFNPLLGLENLPNLVTYSELEIDVKTFDNNNVSNYLMPDEYKQFDWVVTHVMSEVTKHDLWDNYATKA